MKEKPTEKQLFDALISQTAYGIWVSLGKLQNPVSGETSVDLDQASIQIDMLDMINKHVIPAVEACEKGPLSELQSATGTLRSAVDAILAADSPEEAATLARVLRLETMESIRETCDAAEAICPDDCWTLPSYKDLLFLDKTIE